MSSVRTQVITKRKVGTIFYSCDASLGGNTVVVAVMSRRQHISKGLGTVLCPLLALFCFKLSKINKASIFHSRS